MDSRTRSIHVPGTPPAPTDRHHKPLMLNTNDPSNFADDEEIRESVRAAEARDEKHHGTDRTLTCTVCGINDIDARGDVCDRCEAKHGDRL